MLSGSADVLSARPVVRPCEGGTSGDLASSLPLWLIPCCCTQPLPFQQTLQGRLSCTSRFRRMQAVLIARLICQSCIGFISILPSCFSPQPFPSSSLLLWKQIYSRCLLNLPELLVPGTFLSNPFQMSRNFYV